MALVLGLSFSTRAQRAQLSLEDITKRGTFRAKSVYGLSSMNDGERYTAYTTQRQIARFAYATGQQEAVLFDPAEHSAATPDLKQLGGYFMSPTEQHMMLETHIDYIYRRSYTAVNYLYDLNSKRLTPLSSGGPQIHAEFSPDGKKVAFVRGNNLFVVDIERGTEQQLTSDGQHGHVLNGLADWVYEEEFSLTTAFRWSPDSRRLAYYRFDESQVKLFNMTTFGGQLYPENSTFKYPKCGEQNSVVSIHVHDLQTGRTATMDVGPNPDQYISRIDWTTNPNELCMVRLNRLQNKVDILLADASSGASRTLYSESNKSYISETSDTYPLFTPDGKGFIIESEKDGYKHLYLFDMQGRQTRQLTSGPDELVEVYGLAPDGKTLYYRAHDGGPMNTAVYAVSVGNAKVSQLSTQKGTNYANFSSTFRYYALYHSSTTSPLMVTLHNHKGKAIRVMEDNHELRQRIKGYELPSKEFFSFRTSEGVELNGYMIKPFGFDSTRCYPVLMYQYSGPGSITAVNRFEVAWNDYIASLGYLVVCVDGRGTGGRGEQFKKVTYGQLGLYESDDQIATARYLQQLPYVDANRIGIWGWSYGGYMSSLCLFKGADVFRMAIAVAPVTNWRYYDSVYTERYMGLPQDNPMGYDGNSPINHVDKLRGKLLIVHGTADDNVHYQNALAMVEKLVEANKQFSFFTYPDKNHFIRGGNTSHHLYTMLTSYVRENL